MSKTRERCGVPGCSSRGNDYNDISFHSFPLPNQHQITSKYFSGPIDKYEAWKQCLRVSEIKPPKMKVCSLHFKKEDYILPDMPTLRKRLYKNAVPSLNLPHNLELKTVPKKKTIQMHSFDHTYTTAAPSVVEKQPGFIFPPFEFIKIEGNYLKHKDDDEVDFLKDPVKALMNKSSKTPIYMFSDALTTDAKLCHATGISRLEILDAIVSKVQKLCGDTFESRKIKTKERIILTYTKLRHNLSYRLLALMFSCVSDTSCKKIFLDTIGILNRCLVKPSQQGQETHKVLPSIQSDVINTENSEKSVKLDNKRIMTWSIVKDKMSASVQTKADEICNVLNATVDLNSSISHKTGS
ncbi:uncharacterized protein LOC106658864 [Trichogramma pretiosum]|uniref:uncharacterized protein LOC106658864 n=1 Tax=Trichogramma pretiosum TaxID=7493 RepID=UPI0006C981E8|nr:uncharacterized protein LOC106658864 [Trichogramma pretiosum]